MIILESLNLNISIESPQTYKNLIVYPLIGNVDIKLDYLTLDEALKNKVVEIEEVDGGRVSELLVVNKSKRDLLIINGEELIGAMQNRTINVTIMISAESSLKVPVSCTERGRWYEREDGIRMKRISHHFSSPNLRMVLASSVTDSVKRRRKYDSDQLGVWNTINNTMRDLNIVSDTSAQSDIFSERKEEIDDYLYYFHILPSQVGIIGLINNKVMSIELFGKANTFSMMFKKLLRSFVVDAISNNAISNKEGSSQIDRTISDLMKGLRKAKIESYKAPGKGEHLIIETKGQKGIALSVDGEIVHLLLFSESSAKFHERRQLI